MMVRCHTFGKKNTEGPEGWESNDRLPWYDPKEKYGAEISGAISKGYTREEVERFFHSIEKFASYAFNKSHSATYSYIGYLMAWLKTYYPVEFWCATLSTEADKDQRKRYIECAEQESIFVKHPDIRYSEIGFSIHNGDILFGLGAIAQVGETLLVAIKEEREKSGPFTGLADIRERIPKKILRTNSLINMIKAGCFDFEESDRTILINTIKEGMALEPWSEKLCIKYEEESLNIPVTYKPWWNTVPELDVVTIVAILYDVKQYTSKNMKAYGRGKFRYQDYEGNCVLWPAVFTKYKELSEAKETSGEYKITGLKEKGYFKINRISAVEKEKSSNISVQEDENSE